VPRILHHVVLFITMATCAVPAAPVVLSHPQAQPSRRSDDEVRKDIQAKLSDEPELKGLSISVKVDAQRVVLGGRVHSIAQRNKALEIAHAFAEGRQVIDDFEIIPQALIR
jgi:osmotically-inducible protein OsmY